MLDDRPDLADVVYGTVSLSPYRSYRLVASGVVAEVYLDNISEFWEADAVYCLDSPGYQWYCGDPGELFQGGYTGDGVLGIFWPCLSSGVLNTARCWTDELGFSFTEPVPFWAVDGMTGGVPPANPAPPPLAADNVYEATIAGVSGPVDFVAWSWANVGSFAVDVYVAGESDRPLTYRMDTRFGLDRKPKDGLVDYFNTPAQVDPGVWRVELDLPGCDRRRTYSFKVDGDPVKVKKKATGTYVWEARTEGKFRVSATAGATTFASDVVVQDWLIVGLGDSMGSGEGNPDQVAPAPRWQSKRCDRSARSFEALAATDIEEADRRTSVTFVHLACSGAGITAGLLGPYEGINFSDRAPLAAQLSAAKRLAGRREIDAVVISIGVNEARFADVVKFCLLQEDCANQEYEGGQTLAVWLGGRMAALEDPDPTHPYALDLYQQLADALARAGVPKEHVYIPQYPNLLTDRNGDRCEYLVDVFPGESGTGAITRDEVDFLSSSFLTPLNAAVAKAAEDHGWRLIGGVEKAFRGHGYCAGDARWIRTLEDSLVFQGDGNGTLHPNLEGHYQIANLLTPLLDADFYPNGVSGGPPRLPQP